MSLTWSPSTDTNVVGYKIYYGGASRTYTNVVDVGNSTNVTINGLVDGVTYYFAATAYNIVGLESEFSNETTYTVPAPNQPPTLNALSNLAINEGAGQQTVNLSGIGSGSVNESQTLTVTATSGNTGLIPNPSVNYTSPNATGSLTFTPVAFASGSATITVTVNDGAASNNIVTRTFTVTVAPVNQAPTLNVLSNLSINESAGQQTVSLSGITSGAANENQTLTITAASGNTGLIPNPTVSYTSPNATGSLTFTPAPFASGSATITVTVNDGGASNNIVTRTFTVAVGPVNQAPTLNALGNLSLNQNAGQQTVNLSGITSGATNESQTLTVTAGSSNTGLIPNPTVTYTSPNTTGSLRFTPVASASGSATITVTVNDGGASNNIVTRTFAVTVNAPPTISSIADQTIATNTSAGPIAFTVGDAETAAANLTLQAASSVPTLIPAANIVFGGSGASRTVTLTPLPAKSGNATIAITVSDGGASSTRTFALAVLASPTPPGLLTVVTNGAGSVSLSASKSSMLVGKTYTATAVPAPGQIFKGWSGSANSSSPKLSFVMTSNFVLQANFMPSPFIPIAGTYNGLFYEGAGVQTHSAGPFSATITTKGTYSGRLQIGSRRYSIKGQLTPECRATNWVPRIGLVPLIVEISVGTNNPADRLSGRVTDGTWVSDLSADRAVFNIKTNPASYAGAYTMVVPGLLGDASLPAGDGIGTVRVDASGRVRFIGTLADGTKVSQSAMVSKEGAWPFYASLYAGNGVALSWITFSDQSGSDLAGPLMWIKPASAVAKYYRDGFTNECSAVGSAYAPPPVGSNVLSFTSGSMFFEGGNLATDFFSSITLGPSSQVTDLSGNGLVMSFSQSLGTFRGKVIDPSSGQTLPFSGIVLQKLNLGFGLQLGTNQSSQVSITP